MADRGFHGPEIGAHRGFGSATCVARRRRSGARPYRQRAAIAYTAGALLVALGAALAPARAAEPRVAGFEVTIHASGFDQPTAIEFAPDGRLFVAERGGRIRIVTDGVVSPDLFGAVEVFTDNENGLLGLALDPDFAANGRVYVFATVTTTESKIIAFVEARGGAADGDGSGGAATGGAAVDTYVVKDRLPTRGSFHSGGGLKVGPDGKLYFGIGDTFLPEAAQDLTSLAGKISRINLDGTIPSDNPFVTPTGAYRATFALGFRNPFRFTFAPDGRLFVLDVGSDGSGRREEVNLVRAGDNCGWPLFEGRQSGLVTDPRFRDPIYDYHEGGAAPVGAVYYTGANFPTRYRDDLFYLEYVLNRLYHLDLDGDRVVGHSLFVQAEGGPVDLVQGPDGALYYCEIDSGNIRRIAYRASPADTPTDTPADDDVLPIRPPFFGLCGLGALPAALATALTLRLARGARRPCR
ncbi:MAG: sorbosone dehydrogenase family protein [Phycisphaerae bacterium]